MGEVYLIQSSVDFNRILTQVGAKINRARRLFEAVDYALAKTFPWWTSAIPYERHITGASVCERRTELRTYVSDDVLSAPNVCEALCAAYASKYERSCWRKPERFVVFRTMR